MPRHRGTVSGRLSHTKVFHRGREHAKLRYSQSPTVDVDRRLSLSQQPSARRPLVMGSTTRENWANPLAVPSTADPGRPLSPLLSFVSHIFKIERHCYRRAFTHATLASALCIPYRCTLTSQRCMIYEGHRDLYSSSAARFII